MESTPEGSDPPAAGARPPGRARSTTAKGRGTAAPAKEKAVGVKKRGSRSPAADGAPVRPAPTPEDTADPSAEPFRLLRRRPRSALFYNRRLQRTSEQWPTAARVGASLFAYPDLVLALLGRRPPVEADGRVLNRGTQALIELAARLLPTADPDGSTVFDPVAMRPQLRRMARAAMPVRTDVHVVGRIVPGPSGAPPLPVRVYRQFGAGLGTGDGGRGRPPAILFLHGGGWVTGDLDSHDALCRLLAAVSGCIVVAVGYRLAPEDPYPAAVDDALAAYRWVHQHSAEVGHADGYVGVMGDSAGGNLAAVVAREARSGTDDGVPPPVAQGLVYPALDARLDSPSVRAFSEGFFLTRASMEFSRSCYLPDRDQWESPCVSPVLVDDHQGLAPALVVTAGFDPLRDEGATYAGAVAAAGVPVDYRCYDDQVHGFMSMGILPDSLALATEVCDSMGRLMRRSMRAAL